MNKTKKYREPDSWDIAKTITEFGMIVGPTLTIEHKIGHDRWYDEDKDQCHGKAGLIITGLSVVGRILLGIFTPPRCLKCGTRMMFNTEYNSHYCDFCDS